MLRAKELLILQGLIKKIVPVYDGKVLEVSDKRLYDITPMFNMSAEDRKKHIYEVTNWLYWRYSGKWSEKCSLALLEEIHILEEKLKEATSKKE